MSDAKQCDRCGKLYSPDITNFDFNKDWWRYNIYKDNHPMDEYKLDLCNECRKKLYIWIKEGK